MAKWTNQNCAFCPSLIVIIFLSSRERNFPIPIRRCCRNRIGAFPLGLYLDGFPCFRFDSFGLQHHRDHDHNSPFPKLRKCSQIRIWDPGDSNYISEIGELRLLIRHTYGNLCEFVLEIGALVPPRSHTSLLLCIDTGTLFHLMVPSFGIRVLLLKQKSKYCLALMEFTQFCLVGLVICCTTIQLARSRYAIFRIGPVTEISEGEYTFISFHFARIINLCSKCGSLKHDIKECLLITEMYSDQRKDSYSQCLVLDYMRRQPNVLILHHLFMNVIFENDEVSTPSRWLLVFWDWELVYLGLQVDSKNGTSDFKKRKHLLWQQIWGIRQRRLPTDQCESFPATSNVLISTKRQDTVFSPTTSSSHFKSKVMLKAFWSLSSKLIANNKYVKEGHNRFHLLARKAFDSRVTLHSFIEIVSISYICVQWLFCIYSVPCKLL